MNSYNKILSFQNDFYKQLYDDTLKQRETINNKFTPTITILSAEVSGIIWFIFKLTGNIEKNQNVVNMLHLCTFASIFVTLSFLVTAIVYFILCFTNYNFSYPSPQKVQNYIEENKKYVGDYSEKEVLNNIINNISDEYIKMAIDNCEEINKHSAHLNNCYRCIVTVLAFLVIDFILVVF